MLVLYARHASQAHIEFSKKKCLQYLVLTQFVRICMSKFNICMNSKNNYKQNSMGG